MVTDERNPAVVPRHYGLDWLRITAFGLLILFHIGLYFLPWNWHVTTLHPREDVRVPMFLTLPWRMSLLFLVSGYAARALLRRTADSARFARSRSLRLLLPVAAGVALWVVPQIWVEAVFKDGYVHGFSWFWLHDYLRMGPGGTPEWPRWMHLWFLLYIWAYSLVLALAAWLLPDNLHARAQALFDRAFAGSRVLILPIAWLLLLRVALFPGQMPTNNLSDDGLGHLFYLPSFLFGVALAGSTALWPTLRRWWPTALALALAAWIVILWFEVQPFGLRSPGGDYIAVLQVAYAVMQWSAIAALLGLADRYLNIDSRWRAPLNAAVFPFYIAHQTAIVVIGWYIRPFQLPPLIEFAILLAGTVAACWLFYGLARAAGPLRPLFGLGPPPARGPVPQFAKATT